MNFVNIVQFCLSFSIFILIVWMFSMLLKLDKLITLLYNNKKSNKNGGSNESSS